MQDAGTRRQGGLQIAYVALGDLQISTGGGQVADYIVSEAHMNHLTTTSPNMMMAMIDSGANVNLGPPSLATDLGLQLFFFVKNHKL